MTGPLEHAPRAIRPPFDVARPDDGAHDQDAARWREARHAGRVDVLLGALDGIELGAYDRRLVEHLAAADTPELGGIVSLVLRARAAGPLPHGTAL